MTIGAKIAALRKAAGLRQSELARRAGILQPTVCQLEKGRRDPERMALGIFRRLAAALDVPLGLLVNREE